MEVIIVTDDVFNYLYDKYAEYSSRNIINPQLSSTMKPGTYSIENPFINFENISTLGILKQAILRYRLLL